MANEDSRTHNENPILYIPVFHKALAKGMLLEKKKTDSDVRYVKKEGKPSNQ